MNYLFAVRSWILTLSVALASSGGACASGSVSIPFQLDDNLVHVVGQINDQPLSSVLDSGTGGVILNLAASQKLHLVEENPSHPALGGGSNSQPLLPVPIRSVRLGPVDLVHVSGFAMDLQGLAASAGFSMDAILGEPLFEAGVVKIDYRTLQLTFRSSSKKHACSRPIPIEIVNGVPVVEVALRPRSGDMPVVLHLIVDLGTRHFAAVVGGPFLNSEIGRHLFRSGEARQIATGTGGAVIGKSVRVNEMRVGTHRFENLDIALTDQVRAFELGFADGSLGVPLWKQGTIAFDYPNREFCLE